MKILFVCMGNICRSPTVEGVFRAKLEEHPELAHVEVDSCGTHAYHVNEPPDPRSVEAAARRGIDLSLLRARAVSDSDFEVFDLILAMDQDNLDILIRMSDSVHHDKVRLFLNDAEMPDPYYGGASGFELALDLAEQGSISLIKSIS